MNLDTFMQALTLVAFLVGLWKFMPAVRVKADLDEKDRTIQNHEQSIKALETRVETLERQLGDARERGDRYKDAATRWEASYREQEKYTAKGMVEDLKGFITEIVEKGAERQQEMLDALGHMGEVVTTAVQAQSELTQTNTALVAAVAQKLDVHRPLGS